MNILSTTQICGFQSCDFLEFCTEMKSNTKSHILARHKVTGGRWENRGRKQPMGWWANHSCLGTSSLLAAEAAWIPYLGDFETSNTTSFSFTLSFKEGTRNGVCLVPGTYCPLTITPRSRSWTAISRLSRWVRGRLWSLGRPEIWIYHFPDRQINLSKICFLFC